MLSTLRHFFAFCQKENRNLFYRSLGLGVLMAILNGLKYPAIYLVLNDFTAGMASGRTIIHGLLILISAGGRWGRDCARF